MPTRVWMISNFAGVAASLVGVGCGPTGPSADTLADTSTTQTEADTTDTETGTDTGGCELPSDAPLGPDTATITIRNDSAVPAYVLPNSPFGCNYSQIQIEVDGQPVKWDHWGVYRLPCDECEWGCSDGGANGLIVNPGASAEVVWNGGIWPSESLSPECVALGLCNGNPLTECEVRANFTGEYTAIVELAQDCPGDDQAACACAEDVCPLFVYEPGYFEVWQRFEASASFPAGAEIVITD
jgi:hypothetical protein